MSDEIETFIQKAVRLAAEDRARLERPRAEERARRRWGVRSTCPPKRGQDL